MKTPKNNITASDGFTLIAVLIAIIVVGLLAGMIGPSVFSALDAADLKAEKEAVASMKTDVESSFNETDFTRNIGAISGTGLGTSSAVATTFASSTNPGASIANTVTTAAYAWQNKLCLVRGSSLTNGSVLARDSDPTGVYFNRAGWTRIMIIGPTNESSQRYLLISMLTPAHRQLTFPTGATTFDEIWNNSWEAAGSTAPSAWSSRLTAAQYALWNEVTVNKRTNAARVLVQRITQGKYTLTIVNNHPTDTAWVDIGPITNAIVATPNSGVTTSASITELATGIPSGRQVVVRRGTAIGTAVEVQRFLITAPITVTVQ